VITDLMQTILLYGGALLVIGVVTWKMGGFGWFPTEWQENWDTQPIIPTSFRTRVSVVGSILSVLVWYVATSGGDQVSVQRFMATKDARAARRAIGMQLLVAAVVTATLAVVGFALLGYFRQNPGQLREGMTVAEHADDIFPFFIAGHLPPVISGLVLSGLFAAAMSSIDSGVNSITAVVTTDFIDRFRHQPISEARHVLLARIIAFSVGAVVVIGSTFIDRVPGNITAVTTKTVNLLTVPIFCLFFFALFDKKARPAGVWAGAVCGVGSATLIAFSGPIFGADRETGLDPVSFQWISPVALIVNIAVGMLVNRLLPSRRPAQSGEAS
jgi:SSS family solute:Na+ symporter